MITALRPIASTSLANVGNIRGICAYDGGHYVVSEYGEIVQLVEGKKPRRFNFCSPSNIMPPAIATTADGSRVIHSDSEGYVHVWDAAAGEKIYCHSGPHGVSPTAKGMVIEKLYLSPDGNRLIKCSRRDCVVAFSVWNAEKRRYLSQVNVEGHLGAVSGMAVLRDEMTVVASDLGMNLGVTHVTKWPEPNVIEHPQVSCTRILPGLQPGYKYLKVLCGTSVLQRVYGRGLKYGDHVFFCYSLSAEQSWQVPVDEAIMAAFAVRDEQVILSIDSTGKVLAWTPQGVNLGILAAPQETQIELRAPDDDVYAALSHDNSQLLVANGVHIDTFDLEAVLGACGL